MVRLEPAGKAGKWDVCDFLSCRGGCCRPVVKSRRPGAYMEPFWAVDGRVSRGRSKNDADRAGDKARRKKAKRIAGNRARVKKGTVVKILETKTAWDGTVWIRVKSGWLPVVKDGKWRVSVNGMGGNHAG